MYIRFEVQAKIENNEIIGGRVKGHANWKTIEEESRKFATIAKRVAQSAPETIVEEDL